MDVGKRITNLRATKGLSTTALAHKAGLAQSHLRDIELGNKNPTIETLSYICDALEISLAEFFAEETVLPAECIPEKSASFVLKNYAR